MRFNKKFLIGVACAALVAACGGNSDTTSTTTTIVTGQTTAAADSTEATAPAATPTTDAPTTSTTGAPEATGDLGIVHAAMSKSVDAAPSRIEGVLHMAGVDTGEAQPTDMDMPFSVQTDPASGNTSMVMDLSSMTGGDTEGLPAEMLELFGNLEVRQIGDTVYMKFPFFTAMLGAETEWISLPAEEQSDATGGLTGASPSNPTSFLDSFANAEGSATEIGAEDVRGISTTHYRVVLDESWQDKLTAEQLADLKAQGPLPDASFPMDLWIDGDGIVHKMTMEMTAEDLPEDDDGSFESMTMTFDFYDFGQSVTVEAPPADQVTAFDDLSGLFGTSVP